ncbi:MAG: tetratricopeptide repeat protein [Deltaproteobacteria bacterium]|nr:tetratricopeptide repeat protein [Deltaproteobacteria bacterium]
MDFIKRKLFCTLFVVFLLAPLFFMGCSPKPRAPESMLDTPKHHVSSGLKLLEKNYLNDAQREFELALQLDPKYSDAHRGLGLTYGKEKKFELALESMRSARDTAKTKQEKALAYVGFMRIYTMEQGKQWLEKVKERFSDALQYKEDLPEIYYYMGMAYKKANKSPEARKAFKKVLAINKGLIVESQHQLKSLR